mgnify:CR=1 FL=1
MSTKFIIRPGLSNDWGEIILIYNYYILNSAFNFEYDIYTVQSRLSWFEQFQNETAYQLLVGCNKDNQVVGYAASTPFNQTAGYYTSVNISIYCHPEYINIGLGSKLLQTLMAQSESTNIHRMYAGITMPNNASLQLFKKYGFIQTAYFEEVGYKFNQYWDVVWLGKSR